MEFLVPLVLVILVVLVMLILMVLKKLHRCCCDSIHMQKLPWQEMLWSLPSCEAERRRPAPRSWACLSRSAHRAAHTDV